MYDIFLQPKCKAHAYLYLFLCEKKTSSSSFVNFSHHQHVFLVLTNYKSYTFGICGFISFLVTNLFLL